jgi:DNA-binding response OmpR family regulator
MEPLNGIEFVKLVRTAEDSKAKLVPIIMLTAYSERSKVEAARDAGATEFCTKPVTATEIYRKVAAVVNNPRPYVRTRRFFGPDRRRHPQMALQGADRRNESFELPDPQGVEQPDKAKIT